MTRMVTHKLDPLGLGLVPDARRLRFTERERAVLEHASEIAARARRVLRAEYGEYVAEDLPIDLELAHVEQGAAAVLDEDADWAARR